MRSALLVTTLTSVFLLAGCAAQADDGAETTAGESALTSAKLEKSHIEVFLEQENTQGPPITTPTYASSGECTIDAVTFRITYANPTLPAGTKVTVHIGESFADQSWIGDGFGFASYSKGTWGNVRDVVMTGTSGKLVAETKGNPYVENPPGQYYWGMPGPRTHAAEIVFVFRLQLPDGTVLWDNRLNRDYWVSGNGPSCPDGTTGGFVSRASWGPF